MNGTRPVRYRRPKGRGKKIKFAVIIIAVFVIAAVLLFLIIGNILNNKVSGTEKDRTTNISDISDTIYIQPVKAFGVASGGSISDISAAITDGADFDADGLSYPLKGVDGEVVYSSQIMKNFNMQSMSDTKITLAQIKSAAKGRYLSALLEVTAFSETDTLKRSLLLSFDAAIAGEAVSGGFNDVLIRARGIDKDNYFEIIRLAEQIKGMNPDATIGFAINETLASAENISMIVDDLWSAFDFLAIDLTAATSVSENPVDSLSAGIRGMQYYILRYEMRILISKSDKSENLSGIFTALSENGISNWQII